MKGPAFAALLLVAAACGDSSTPARNEAAITCDALAKCNLPPVSVTALLCTRYISEPNCGAAYRGWLQCYTQACMPDATDDEGGVTNPCPMEYSAWQVCQRDHLLDAGHLD